MKLSDDIFHSIIKFLNRTEITLLALSIPKYEKNKYTKINYPELLTSIDLIQWSIKCGIDISKVCDAIAKNGCLDCLTYAHRMGYPWNKQTCIIAATNGHLNILTYIHKNGCPLDHSTCDNAALNNHNDCFIYAHRYGCPYDLKTRRYATKGGIMLFSDSNI